MLIEFKEVKELQEVK